MDILISILSCKWLSYTFMQYALLTVTLLSIIFGLLGSLIIDKRMAFFADAYGHSTFTGLAIGALLGISPTLSMLIFTIFFALGINYIKSKNILSSDTIIGVFASFASALGLCLLSREGGFSKYSSFLVGDILTIQPSNILSILLCLIVVIAVWLSCFNKFLALSCNRSIAQSKGIKYYFYENIFTVLVACVVVLSIKIVGILLISALIILPAASSKNIARNIREAHLFSVLIALLSGLIGLILSFYLKTASGPSIALTSSLLFFLSLCVRKNNKNT